MDRVIQSHKRSGKRIHRPARLRAVTIALTGLLAVLLAALPASADPGTAGSKQTEAAGVLLQINELNSRLNHAAEAYNGAVWRLGTARKKIRENARNLRAARKNLSSSQQSLAERIVDVYTSPRNDSTLAVLLGASTLEDLINGLDATSRVTHQNARVVRDVTVFRDQVQRSQQNLESLSNRLNSLVAERAAQRAAIGVQLSRRQRLLGSIKDQIVRLKASEQARQLQLARAVRFRISTTAARSSSSEPPPTTTGQPATLPLPPTSAPPARYGGVVAVAMRYLGVPYVWGGSTPSGFDCSGFTMYVYAQIGVSLPHYTGAQWQMGTAVARNELQPGDLMFFDGLGHEGMYIGNNQFIHAPHTGDVVKISSLTGWYSSTYMGARRL